MDEMTEKQQELVLQGQWIVNTALKRINRQYDDELRSRCQLYLCELALKFDESRGTKFSTYAYFALCRYAVRQSQYEQRDVLLLTATPIENADSKSVIDIADKCIADIQSQNAIATAFSVLDRNEQRILNYHLQGYNHKDIAQALNCTPAQISRKYVKLIAKLKDTLRI